MNWSKAKNIILAMLIAVNIFLLGVIVYTERSSHIAYKQAVSETVAYLESRNISLDPKLLSVDVAKRNTLLIIRDYDAEAAIAETLVNGEEVSRSGGVMRFANDSGTENALWRSGGLFEANIKVDGISEYNGNISEHPTVTRLGGVGFSGGIVSDISNSDLTQLTISQTYNSLPIFNAAITVTCGEKDEVYAAGRWCVGTEQIISDANEQKLTGLLIRFAQQVEYTAENTCVIEAITPGYMAQNLSNSGVKLVPAWEIRTSDAIGYISAVDGSALS